VLNFVRIHAIASELWAINEIQNGDRRHLEFIIIANFGYAKFSALSVDFISARF